MRAQSQSQRLRVARLRDGDTQHVGTAGRRVSAQTCARPISARNAQLVHRLLAPDGDRVWYAYRNVHVAVRNGHVLCASVGGCERGARSGTRHGTHQPHRTRAGCRCEWAALAPSRRRRCQGPGGPPAAFASAGCRCDPAPAQRGASERHERQHSAQEVGAACRVGREAHWPTTPHANSAQTCAAPRVQAVMQRRAMRYGASTAQHSHPARAQCSTLANAGRPWSATRRSLTWCG